MVFEKYINFLQILQILQRFLYKPFSYGRYPVSLSRKKYGFKRQPLADV